VNIDSHDTPLVLLCPAWKKWGTATTVKKNTTIIHSREDDVVPFRDSLELIENSVLPASVLIEVGDDHRLADPEPLAKMLEACWDDQYHAIHESAHAVVGLHLGLTPKKISVGRTSSGTSGDIEFCSQAALGRDPLRRLSILVAGKVATRLLGYTNRLVSEELELLPDDDEPGYTSDEWFIWDDEFSQQEIVAAESQVLQILERKHYLLTELADALVAKRQLNKDDIRAIVAKSRQKAE
jgi:hypothetical protein